MPARFSAFPRTTSPGSVTTTACWNTSIARELTKQVVREIRRQRPDAVLSIDPGAPYEQWHKSDHRSGAVITADAMRAAAWRLYFPELEREGLKHHNVPVAFFFYSNQPNYTVDITDVLEKKAKAAAAHTSQFGNHGDELRRQQAGRKAGRPGQDAAGQPGDQAEERAGR